MTAAHEVGWRPSWADLVGSRVIVHGHAGGLFPLLGVRTVAIATARRKKDEKPKT